MIKEVKKWVSPALLRPRGGEKKCIQSEEKYFEDWKVGANLKCYRELPTGERSEF